MIDLNWINNLEIEFSNGLKIEKCLGIGADAIVFKAIYEGQELALRVQKDNIGFVIREFPPMFINTKNTYDIIKLNLKLINLIGNPNIDRFSGCYNELCTIFVKTLIEDNTKKIMNTGDYLGFQDEIRFFINSYSIKERLNEIKKGASSSEEYIYEFKNPYFNYIDSKDEIIRIISEALTEITSDFYVENLEMKSEVFYSNPLFVWGAAIMDGFITTKEEIDATISFINSKFGKLTDHLNIHYYLNYANFLATFIYNFTNKNQKEVEAFVKF